MYIGSEEKQEQRKALNLACVRVRVCVYIYKYVVSRSNELYILWTLPRDTYILSEKDQKDAHLFLIIYFN